MQKLEKTAVPNASGNTSFEGKKENDVVEAGKQSDDAGSTKDDVEKRDPYDVMVELAAQYGEEENKPFNGN